MRKHQLISDAAVQMYKEKMTFWEISKNLGVDFQTAKSAIENSDCVLFSRSKLLPDEEQEICSLYVSGERQLDIALKYKTSKYTILKILRKNNIPTRNRSDYCKFNKNFFEKGVVSEETAYFLGLLMADGCITRANGGLSYVVTISLHGKDLDVLLKMKKSFQCENDPSLIARGNQFYYSFASKIFGEDLIDLGCVPNKSLILKWPDGILDNKFLNHFVRGYFDGDGSFYVKGSQQKVIILGTKWFCQRLNEEISKNIPLIDLKKLERHPNNNITKRYVFGGGKQFREFYKWLYKDANIFMNRKAKKGFEAFKIAGKEKEIFNNPKLTNLSLFLNAEDCFS